jgi:hypothetical protein
MDVFLARQDKVSFSLGKAWNDSNKIQAWYTEHYGLASKRKGRGSGTQHLPFE